MAPTDEVSAASAAPAKEKEVVVALSYEPRLPMTQHLDEALARGQFFKTLDCLRIKQGRPPMELRITIKPDMDFFQAGAATGTSPALVEALVERLAERGYQKVTVIDGCNVDDSWLYNREPLNVPDLVGYRFCTEAGYPYEVVGAGASLTRVDFGNGTAEEITSEWLGADVRIVFAKNKTDEGLVFALGVFNLLGLMPAARFRTQAGLGVMAPMMCVELLRRAPVHFCLIDALVSSHGPAGSRRSRPLKTDVLITSSSLLLADWAAAVKMGADPYASPINAFALEQIGLPDSFEILGDMKPYPLWQNPHPLMTDSVRNRDRIQPVARLARAFSQPVDRELFPVRELGLDRANAYFTHAGDTSGAADETAGEVREGVPSESGWWALPFNYLTGVVDRGLEALRVLYQKDRLPWVELPIEFDYQKLMDRDFEEIETQVENEEKMLQDAPSDRHGHQWRIAQGAVLFRGRHVLSKDFDAFTQTVEIHRAIQFMNDYIGGSALPFRHSVQSKVDRQVERNIYLPQPNWIVLFGGPSIDVEKIEKVRYEADRHKIWWRTVHSSNGSAERDDGSVEFRRTAVGTTEIVIFTLQKFRLPAALAALRVELLPELHHALVESAYANFFQSTIRNLARRADGLPYRIGRPGIGTQPSCSTSLADFSVWAAAVAGGLADFIQRGPALMQALKRYLKPQSTHSSAVVDRNGFRHFSGSAGDSTAHAEPAPALGNWFLQVLGQSSMFMSGLSEAMQKDLATMSREGPP